ncbi:MAG: pentapeptide repeat-containing protein [Desulfobulbaceae bacterium]
MKGSIRILVVTLGSAVVLTGTAPAAPVPQQRGVVEENVRLLQETNACPGCDLAGAILYRGRFAGADLRGANLAGAGLNLADLAGADLREANLQGASLGGADLAGADLTGANLTGAMIEGAYLVGAKMDSRVETRRVGDEADASGAVERTVRAPENRSKPLPYTGKALVKEEERERAAPVQMTGSTPLPAADSLPVRSKKLQAMNDVVVATDASPPAAGRSGGKEKPGPSPAPEMVVAAAQPQDAPAAVILPAREETPAAEPVDPAAQARAKLVEKLLDDNRCVGCDLAGVDLSGRDLEDADLERVNLRGADLHDIDLEGANLKGADLRETNLRDADLREADLYRADLRGADLTGAKLDGALIDSLQSEGVKGADFSRAVAGE